MDFVAKTDETSIPIIIQPTYGAFLPLLEKNRSKIESVKRETFKYGELDRHMLDVYYSPTSSSMSGKPPILIFAYGGGFTQGDRISPPPMDLVYACTGAFFASRGILTVIVDYRLVPEIKYPEPVEDIRDALAFVVQRLGDAGDTSKIFMKGHSAGASLVSSLFLHEPNFIRDELKGHVKGLVLLGAPYHFNGPPAAPSDVLTAYYGDSSAIQKNCPYGLLQASSEETISSLPPLYIVRAEKEPPSVVLSHGDFVKLLKEKSVNEVHEDIAKGHNHISPQLALSTGEGEEWAEDVATWIKSHAANK